ARRPHRALRARAQHPPPRRIQHRHDVGGRSTHLPPAEASARVRPRRAGRGLDPVPPAERAAAPGRRSDRRFGGTVRNRAGMSEIVVGDGIRSPRTAPHPTTVLFWVTLAVLLCANAIVMWQSLVTLRFWEDEAINLSVIMNLLAGNGYSSDGTLSGSTLTP